MIGLAALAVTAPLRLDLLWYAVFTLAIGAVLACEAINASLEYLSDHLHPEFAAEIGHVKDAAAVAVLIASSTSVIVGTLMIVSGIVAR